MMAGFLVAACLRAWEENRVRKYLAEARKPIYSIQCCYTITAVCNPELICSRYTYSRVKEMLCELEWISECFPFVCAYDAPEPWAEWLSAAERDKWLQRLK